MLILLIIIAIELAALIAMGAAGGRKRINHRLAERNDRRVLEAERGQAAEKEADFMEKGFENIMSYEVLGKTGFEEGSGVWR